MPLVTSTACPSVLTESLLANTAHSKCVNVYIQGGVNDLVRVTRIPTLQVLPSGSYTNLKLLKLSPLVSVRFPGKQHFEMYGITSSCNLRIGKCVCCCFFLNHIVDVTLMPLDSHK